MESAVNPKLILIMIIIIILCIAVFIVMIVFYTSNGYKKIEATVINTNYRIDDGTQNDSNASKNYYVTFKYEIDGKEHLNKCRTLFPFLYKEGKKISVYYDPQNYNVIRNHFIIETCLLGIIFLTIFLFGMFMIYLKKCVKK